MTRGDQKKNKRNITTVEIARRCGISRSTVSAVLNGRPGVRESTRKKVMACIREENYGAGIIARTLVAEMSRMVTVLAPNVSSPYSMMFFRGVNEILCREGYHVLYHNVRPESEEDPTTMESLNTNRPAGYIILKGAEGPQGKHALKILEDEIPLVTETGLSGVETNRVAFDNRNAMKLATDYIIGQGHVRIGHIAGPTGTLRAKLRKTGVAESLIQHDIPLSEAVIVDADDNAIAGYRAALEILKDPKTRPTALLCFNDMVAMGVYRAAHKLGIAIPHDLSVIGFEGIDFVELLAPPLTTVNVFPEKMGSKAAELLLKFIRNEAGRSLIVEEFEPILVERGSVRRINSDAIGGQGEVKSGSGEDIHDPKMLLPQ